MVRFACALLLSSAALAACGTDASPLHLVDLADGDYIGGPQTTRIEVDDDILAARVELYVDGARVAIDELAPFELHWDATEFSEEEHTLQARVYQSGDGTVDARVSIRIDNTAPVIVGVPPGAAQNQPFVVDALDNGLIASTLVVTRQGDLTSSDKFPRTVQWPFGCGVEAIDVRVTDRAGWTTTQSFTVRSGVAGDIDCDGHRAINAGGDDCNDVVPEAHPGAVDGGGAYDLDCDGVPGVDADGDGVASERTGGEDCDDTNTSIHGQRYVFDAVRIFTESGPMTWSPGSSAITGGGGSASLWDLAINKEGTIYLASGSYGEARATAKLAATGANDGSITIASRPSGAPVIAFGRGSRVVLISARAPWTELASIDAGGPVGKVRLQAFEVDGATRFQLAFQVGTTVGYASDSNGTWTARMLGDVGAPVVEIPSINTDRIIVRTTQSIWSLALGIVNVPVARLDDESVVGERVSVAAYYYSGVHYAINRDGVGTVYEMNATQSTPVLTLGRIRRMFTTYSHLLVEVEGQPMRAYRIRTDGLVPTVSTIYPGMSTVDDHWLGMYFASPGLVHGHGLDSVFDAQELEDGVDQNCDGYAN